MVKSKRKTLYPGSDTEDIKAKRKRQSSYPDSSQDSSPLAKLLDKSGYHLKIGNRPNELEKDQTLFQRSLALSLKRNKGNVDDVINGLSSHIEDPVRFRWSLMATATSPHCDPSTRSGQDSLIRLLLGVEALQTKLVNILLEKLPEFTGDDEDYNLQPGEKVNMARLVMTQMRWLDNIVDSQSLKDKLTEVLTVTSVEVQHEVITCIPEILEDHDHADMAIGLSDLLKQNSDLTVPILDALTNLNIPGDLVSDVRQSVLQTLDSVDLEHLPVVVKFLLQSVSGADVLGVITELRDKLDFNSGFLPKLTERDEASNTHRDSVMLTLDAIKSAARFQKTIADSWIKAIENVRTATDHKVIDFLLVVILHSVANKHKPIESLIRNKIRAGLFTDVLIRTTFTEHSQALREYFSSILALAEVLLKSPEVTVTYFAGSVYRHAFTSLDRYCQQEIVGSLVTHIGSGSEAEIDSSLDILSRLVQSDAKRMSPYAVFVKGVLDYLDHLTFTQIRKLYTMLSCLAYGSDDQGTVIIDDMHIIIRKQLSNNNLKYKQMGVIGAISIVKVLGSDTSHAPVASDVAMTSNNTLTTDTYKQVIHLLQLVQQSCSKMPEATALYMDEISGVIKRKEIDAKIEEWIGENVITDFQDNYIVDIEEKLPSDGPIPLSLRYTLDPDTEGAIALNILPLLTKKVKSATDRSPPLVSLSPHFQLVRICEQNRNNGDLEGIDALLGCALIISHEDVYNKIGSFSQQQKEIIATSLFLTLNWFREVIGAFSSQKDAEMMGKVIARLQHITEIQSLLETILPEVPNYVPPIANFDCLDGHTRPPVPTLPAGGTKKRQPTAKKSAVKGKKTSSKEQDETCIPESQTTQTSKGTQDSDKNEKQKHNERPRADLTQYQAYLRELDMDVFCILDTGLITKADLDTEMNTKEKQTIQLQPEQLKFLLADLTRKLDHILISTVSKRKSFLKVRSTKNAGFSQLDQLRAIDVADRVVQLLPALCRHLEGTSAFFQMLIVENDGVIDGPGSDSEEARNMGSCFCLLLRVLTSLLSWNGFVQNENKDLLRNAVDILTGRMADQDTSQISYNDAIRECFSYLEKFSSSVPNLPTAMTLVKLLVTIASKADATLYSVRIAKFAEKILKREWYEEGGERAKGAKHNELLQTVIKIYFTHSEDTMAVVESLATTGMSELLETDRHGCSNTYPSLNRNSYTVFYRCLLSQLVDSIKLITPTKTNRSSQSSLEKLLQWSVAVRIFHVLVNLIKVFDARPNLGAILKHGRQLLEIFLRQGMPLLDTMFRHHKDDVQSLLKNLQLSTRALQHICGHLKIVKDVSLTSQVPVIKKCLETLVYRVKAMLTVNKCVEAFWVGNLKNRDLQGEEILSQATSAEREDSDNEADSIPEDDESDVPVEDDTSDTKSEVLEDPYSESF